MHLALETIPLGMAQEHTAHRRHPGIGSCVVVLRVCFLVHTYLDCESVARQRTIRMAKQMSPTSCVHAQKIMLSRAANTSTIPLGHADSYVYVCVGVCICIHIYICYVILYYIRLCYIEICFSLY